MELSHDQRRDGLWAKAMANSGGSEEKAKSLYIKYRVQSIKDEAEIAESVVEQAISTLNELEQYARSREKT